MFRIAATALVFTALAIPANAFIAQNNLLVERASNSQFEVPYRGLSGVADFWCAAGDYVVRGLGLPASTRIFRVSSPPRRSGQGITFSLSPEGATATGLQLLSGDGSLSASFARQLCWEPHIVLD